MLQKPPHTGALYPLVFDGTNMKNPWKLLSEQNTSDANKSETIVTSKTTS